MYCELLHIKPYIRLIDLSGDQMELIDEIKLGTKISWHIPFKNYLGYFYGVELVECQGPGELG